MNAKYAIYAERKNGEWVHITDWSFDDFKKAYDFSVHLYLESGVNMEVREI